MIVSKEIIINGQEFVRIKSDSNLYIRDVDTGKPYLEAINLKGHVRTYEETDIQIEDVELTSNEAVAMIIGADLTRLEAETYRAAIEQGAQSLPNNIALTVQKLYPPFDKLIGRTVLKGFRFTHDDKLWSTVQPELTIQAHSPPGVGMESLYEEVCETHPGTPEDPIPYSGNMTLELGKFYEQDGAIYECIRDSGNPVYHDLNTLVGLYVQEYERKSS